MSQDQKEIPKEEEKELDNNEIADKEEDKIEKSDSIVEDRFSPPQSSEEEINKEEEVIEIVETPFEENEEPVESTKLADVELEDFVPPPAEEREDFNLPEQKMKASTLKKTIQNIQNVQNKISSEWKKRADNSLSNHRKLNEAIVADIKKDLKFMASELGQATNAETEKIRSEFNNLSQKISQSNELNERVANETTENLIAEIDIALSDVNKNISLNIDKIVNNTATVLGNRRSDILGAKVEVENSITGELSGYRDESEKVISKFSDTSNSALTKMTNTAEETFDQLKNELQSTLNSFKNNSDTILTSFSDQNSDSFNRSKTAISEDIETSKTERISSLARANERASAASEDIKKKIDIKTQSFNNELIQNISDFTVIVEDLHKEGNTSMLELVDKSNVMLNDKIQELNNGISEGLNSVNSAATDSLNSTSDTIKNTINENNKLIETARSSALESLTSLKSENIVSTRQFQEDMRKSITEHLDTVKKEMIGIIDNFGSNHIDRATGASQQIEDNISHSFNESKSYLNNVSKATGESTEININKIKGKINEIESKSVEISKSASVLTSADWDASKQQWNEKSSQIVNDITNNSSAIKSNIEKETSAYKALIEATDHEIMSAYNEQVEGTTRITDTIFEKMNLTANKEFSSAEDVLLKNSKTAMANIASTTETTLNQATRRFDSAKNAINASITLMSTMLETQSSNLLKKMRDSASENQDTLTEYFNNTINQINNVLEDLNKETESNLNGLTKQCEGVTSKSGKKMEHISRKALNQTNEVIDIFMEEFKLQKNVSIDRLVDILHEIPAMLNHLQTKWTTQQESEIISTYAKIQEQYRKLQVNWDKFIADASREMGLFIPK